MCPKVSCLVRFPWRQQAGSASDRSLVLPLPPSQAAKSSPQSHKLPSKNRVGQVGGGPGCDSGSRLVFGKQQQQQSDGVLCKGWHLSFWVAKGNLKLFSPRLANHLPAHHTSRTVHLWMWHLPAVSFTGTVCHTFVETRGGRMAHGDILVQQHL